LNALLGFTLVIVAFLATVQMTIRNRPGSVISIPGISGLRRINIKRKSWYALPVTFVVVLFLGHLYLHWKWSDSFAAGIFATAIAWYVVWYRATPARSRFGGKSIGSFLTGQAKLIMWLVFHLAFWMVVTRIAGWEYTKEWLNGKYWLIYWPMHAIYVSRGVLPQEIHGQLKFGNRITQIALGVLFLFMHAEVIMHVRGSGSLLQAIPGYHDSGSAKLSSPGLHQADSDELAPGSFNVYVVPEGRDQNGVHKRMLIGTLPAGTKWIRIYRIEGRVYADKLIYYWHQDRLAVEDEIRETNYGLPSPDTDGDGYLTLNQSPLWLIVGENLVGWKVIHPDQYVLTAPLGADTPLYALIKSDQEDMGTGFVHLVIRSGT
jgi:hypothetical protein